VRRPALDAADREALGGWIASRVAVALVALAGIWMLGDLPAGEAPSYLSRWNRWDTQLFVDVARFGYRGYAAHTTGRHLEAFFPGEPLALRAVHALTGDWIAAGLLISAVAGVAATVALSRLGELEVAGTTELAGRCGPRAVLYLVLSPYAVFLAAGYSEALFLAFALPSWLAARRGRWLAAGLLAGGAGLVRIDGAFLGLALLVEWATRNAGPRRVRDLPALSAPFLVTAAYFGYLHHVTGDWLAWSHAQAAGWGRHLTNPWTAFHTSYSAARSPTQGLAYAWSFRAEVLAIVLGVALSIVLLVLRRWGEAVFVGLQVVALATSSYYLSVARSTLLWFPLWLLLARWSLRWRWLHVGYLAVSPALMVVGVIGFTTGHWVG
jgi:Mannosyltransferase (PIG-V)